MKYLSELSEIWHVTSLGHGNFSRIGSKLIDPAVIEIRFGAKFKITVHHVAFRVYQLSDTFKLSENGFRC